MRALLTILVFLSVWWFVEHIPTFLVTPLALLSLTGIFAGLVVAGIKWVRNA
jgi:hypothetical protein